MYDVFFPPPFLTPYIECYWIAKSVTHQPMTLHERIFVDARADIILNFGCPYERIRFVDDATETLAISNLDTQRSYPVLIHQVGEVHLVGVRFKPGGLSAFLPMPMPEISNQTIEVSAIFSSLMLELQGRLYDAPNHQAQVDLLNGFFRRLLNPSPMQSYIAEIALQIEFHHGEINIQALSQHVGYSIRTVDRLFKSAFGVSPKGYARIVRFQRALQLLTSHSQFTLAHVAQTCGYYDQAHFAKDFNSFTGQSADVFRKYLVSKTATPPPNLVQILQAT